MYETQDPEIAIEEESDWERVINYLKTSGPKTVKELQSVTSYHSRNSFLKKVLNPMIEQDIVYRDGNAKSPKSVIKIKL